MEIRCLTTGRVRGKQRSGPLRYLPGGWSDETAARARLRRRPSRRRLPLRHRPDSEGGARPATTRAGIRTCGWRASSSSRETRSRRSSTRARCAGSSSRTCTPITSAASRRSHTRTFSSPESNGSAQPACAADCVVTSPSTGRPGSRLGSWTSQDRPPGRFAATHDVAGDGRLLMVPLPGHTPGHAGLLVDGETLLAGDASWPDDGLRVLRAHDPSI